MSRSYLVLLFVPFLMASCSSGGVASATGEAPTMAAEATTGSATATVAPSPTGPEASPAAEEPPGEVVEAALAICTSPDCEYPRLSPGSVHLQPDSGTGADRWCVQARVTMEGQVQLVAVLLIQKAGGSTSGWRLGELQVGVRCEAVE